MSQIPSNVVTTLTKIVNGDLFAPTICKYLSERTKLHRTLDLYRIKLELRKGGFEATDIQFFKMFELWEHAGLGKLKVQKLPIHSTWTFGRGFEPEDVIKVSLDALRGAPRRLTTPVDPEPQTVKQEAHKSNKRENGHLRVVCLVGDEVIPIPFPRDFSVVQAEQLSKFLINIAKLNERGEL